MFNVQYALGNQHNSLEMFDIILAKSEQYNTNIKQCTIHTTYYLFIDRSYIARLTWSGIKDIRIQRMKLRRICRFTLINYTRLFPYFIFK